MIWGVFSVQGVGPLVEINRNTKYAAIYKDILEKNLLTYAKKTMPQDWIFQQDKGPQIHIKVVKTVVFSFKYENFKLAISITELEPN